MNRWKGYAGEYAAYIKNKNMNKIKELNFYVPFKGWMWVSFWFSLLGAAFVRDIMFVPIAVGIAVVMWLSLLIF